MIIGVGADLVSVSKFAERLASQPALRERLFTDAELALAARRAEGEGGVQAEAKTLAARFAAKEALAKALGDPAALSWREVAVVHEQNARPKLELSGASLLAVRAAGAKELHLTISHDGDFALAFVVLEGRA